MTNRRKLLCKHNPGKYPNGTILESREEPFRSSSTGLDICTAKTDGICPYTLYGAITCCRPYKEQGGYTTWEGKDYSPNNALTPSGAIAPEGQRREQAE